MRPPSTHLYSLGASTGLVQWDRLPFLTDVAQPDTPSFAPAPTVIKNNFIWANYGGSQGVDNDDGSSFYHILDNAFYDADGFKVSRVRPSQSRTGIRHLTLSSACVSLPSFRNHITCKDGLRRPPKRV